MAETVPRQRVRDPERREKIVAAAARLIGRNGYSSVSISAIGAKAGIVGSGVYRHFDSKAAVLVAIFDQVIDDLLAGQRQVADTELDAAAALTSIIDGQIEFVVGTRAIAQVYYSELKHLPEADRRRLRRKQRLYIEGWLPLVRELRPELDDARLRTLVHAAMGSIHSSLNHDADLPDAALRQLLADGAAQVLGCRPAAAPADHASVAATNDEDALVGMSPELRNENQ